MVTGGAGFIGSHLVEKLVELEARVIVIDNFQGGKMQNLDRVKDKIQLIYGDVRDKKIIRRSLRDVEIVFHLAANASVPASVENPRYDFETNALGTFNLLEAAVSFSVERFIYASSAAVYGKPAYIPIDENHPLRPISPYGVSKLSGERMGIVFKDLYGLNFVSARIFNAYGPRQPRYVMYDFFHKLRKTPEKLEVKGTGSQIRDFCYVSDVVNALILIIEKGKDDCYNVASGKGVTIKELAELFVSLVSPGARIIYGESTWKGDIPVLLADITKLEKIGFKPLISLRNGVKRTIEWFNSYS